LFRCDVLTSEVGEPTKSARNEDPRIDDQRKEEFSARVQWLSHIVSYDENLADNVEEEEHCSKQEESWNEDGRCSNHVIAPVPMLGFLFDVAGEVIFHVRSILSVSARLLPGPFKDDQP
jgi:hypothetical protein